MSKSSSSATSQGGRGGGGGGTGFGLRSHSPISHATSGADHERDRADQRDDAWRRSTLRADGAARGLSRGVGFGVLAIGSSTVIACGRVHTVITSPLARAIAIGTGGRVKSCRPGLGGSNTKLMRTVVSARSPRFSTRSSGPAPPSGIGKDEARALQLAVLAPPCRSSRPVGSTVSPLPCSTTSSSVRGVAAGTARSETTR